MNHIEYVIGKKIRYVPASEILHLVSSPEELVVLSPACNRLLQLLLSSQGTVLSRDAIFSVLWEQYGYTPSNSSLNTYISLIRKAFINLGLSEDIVVTIPKVGFIFSPDISVNMIEINQHLENDSDITHVTHSSNSVAITTNAAPVNETTTHAIPKHQVELTTALQNRLSCLPILLGVIAGTIIIASTMYIYLSRDSGLPQIEPVDIGQLDGCPVSYLPAYAGNTTTFTYAEVAEIVKSANFPCKTGGEYYFYADKNVTAGQHGKIYVSSCQHRDGKMTSCLDYMNHHFIFSGKSVRY